MTKRRRIAIFVCGGIVVACGLLFLLSNLLPPADPVYQGKKLSSWLDDLDASKPFEAREAAEAAIRNIGAPAVPMIRQWLRKRDSRLVLLYEKLFGATPHDLEAEKYHVRALRACQELGPNAKAAIPEIVGFLNRAEMPELAAAALAKTGPNAVRPLVAALTHTNDRVRIAAAWYVGDLGVESELAVPALVRMLQDRIYQARAAAAHSLGRIQKQAELAVPALVVGLNDTNWSVRNNVLDAIGAYGAAAKVSVPALKQCLNDTNPAHRAWAVVALRKVDEEAAAQAGFSTSDLLKTLQSADEQNKLTSLFAIWWLKEDPSVIVPALIPCLADTSPSIRRLAAGHLGQLKQAAKPALPALTRCLEDLNLSVRMTATDVIARIDPSYLARTNH